MNLSTFQIFKTSKRLAVIFCLLFTFTLSAFATKSSTNEFPQYIAPEEWLELFNENIAPELRKAGPEKCLNIWAQISCERDDYQREAYFKLFDEIFKDHEFKYSELKAAKVDIRTKRPFPVQKIIVDVPLSSETISKLLKACIWSLAFAPNMISIDCIRELAEELKTNTRLTALNLTDNKVGDDGAIAIAGVLSMNTPLVILKLSCCSINDYGTQVIGGALEKNTHLIDLNLHGNNIGGSGARAIGVALEKNPNICLAVLNLGGCKIGVDGAAAIARGLAKNTSLIELDLSQNDIQDKGAIAIAGALKMTKARLTTLNFESNNIGEDAAAEIARILQNFQLTTLDFSCNGIGDRGAKTIAKALQLNNSIKSLYLHSNKIGAEGAKAIAEIIKNTCLTALYFHYNNIGDDGIRAIAESLKGNNYLVTLNLNGTQINDSNIEVIVEALKVNQHLVTLNLSCGNTISYDFLRNLRRTLNTQVIK